MLVDSSCPAATAARARTMAARATLPATACVFNGQRSIRTPWNGARMIDGKVIKVKRKPSSNGLPLRCSSNTTAARLKMPSPTVPISVALPSQSTPRWSGVRSRAPPPAGLPTMRPISRDLCQRRPALVRRWLPFSLGQQEHFSRIYFDAELFPPYIEGCTDGDEALDKGAVVLGGDVAADRVAHPPVMFVLVIAAFIVLGDMAGDVTAGQGVRGDFAALPLLE